MERRVNFKRASQVQLVSDAVYSPGYPQGSDESLGKLAGLQLQG